MFSYVNVLLTLNAQYPVKRQILNASVRSYCKNRLFDLLKRMPKQVDVKPLQNIRKARKQKLSKYPPSSLYLQVIGSGAPGAPKSLYVFTEQKRYLFNCGEGTQRLAFEHKVKLGMLEHILITHKSWSNVGGLPGLLLTLQENGVPEVTLHGPVGIQSLHQDTKRFMRFRDLAIHYRHYAENDGIVGNLDPLTIQTVPLWASENSSDSESDEKESVDESEEDLYAYERPWQNNLQNEEDKLMSEKRKIRQEESRKCKNLAVAYICRLCPKAGTLMPEKCYKAGVPIGPLLGQLKKGEDVTLPNGKVVLAADVKSPDDPGPIFIVVDAPSEAYLDSLRENTAFSKYQDSASCDDDLAEIVVHFTPPDIMRDTRYQEWMSRFSPSTNHLCINDDSLCMGSEAVHRMQYKLNLLNENIFPLLKDKSIPLKKTENAKSCDSDNCHEESGGSIQTKTHKTIDSNNGEQTESSSENYQTTFENSEDSVRDTDYIIGPTHQAASLLTYHLRPKKKLDESRRLVLTPEAYKEECFQSEDVKSVMKKAKLRLLQNVSNADRDNNYPSIIFLGTGSCIPSKTRNASGILVNLSSNKTMMMDCGEGTYGQLVRFYGLSEAEKILQQLVAVYVSHLHADHHTGFIALIQARRKAFERAGVQDVPKLLLLGPPNIIVHLRSYHTNFEPVLQEFTLVANKNFLLSDFKSSESYVNILESLDMKSIDMTYVIHCPNSYGVAWTHKDGWKLAYSGDTMPCENFVKIGQNCNLLIHEATFEDELEDEALIKKHSTVSQAIQVGSDMNAHQILLTHFSQRYAKGPLLQSAVPDNVGIAYDNMKVFLHNLPKLHQMYDAIVKMFEEHFDALEDRTAKKRNAQELYQTEMKETLDKSKKQRMTQKSRK